MIRFEIKRDESYPKSEDTIKRTNASPLVNERRSQKRRPNIWSRKGVFFILRLLLPMVLLGLLFWKIDLQTVSAAIVNAQWRLLCSVVLINLLARWLMAYQTKLGLAPQHMDFSTFALFRIGLISTFYTLLLPGEITGGGIRWYKLSKKQGKWAEAVAVVVFFRLINTLTLGITGFVAMWLDHRVLAIIPRWLPAAFVGVLTLGILPLLSRRVGMWIEGISPAIVGWLPLPRWLRHHGKQLWNSVKVFQRLRKSTLLTIVLLAFVMHLLHISNYILVGISVGIDDLSLWTFGWLRAVVVILQMMPVSILGLGVREASIVLMLQEYGVTAASALSFSLLVFATTVLPAGLLGGVFEAWDTFA